MALTDTCMGLLGFVGMVLVRAYDRPFQDENTAVPPKLPRASAEPSGPLSLTMGVYGAGVLIGDQVAVPLTSPSSAPSSPSVVKNLAS